MVNVSHESMLLLGNNVLRTIHGVGEMMTQMVMSRGVPHSLPDTPPSLRYGKGYFLSDNEDVMVMDTKLKIIEILQVSAPCWRNALLRSSEMSGFSVWFIFGCLSFPHQFILSVRLDYRITYLLSIYKKEFGDNSIVENSSVAEMPSMSREIFFFFSQTLFLNALL